MPQWVKVIVIINKYWLIRNNLNAVDFGAFSVVIDGVGMFD